MTESAFVCVCTRHRVREVSRLKKRTARELEIKVEIKIEIKMRF